MTDDNGASEISLDEEMQAVARRAFEVGGQALSNGETAEAEKIFRSLVEMIPEDAAAHSHLALALLARGAAHEAERHLRRATELAPEDVENWVNLAKLLFSQNRTRRALRALAEAARRAPDDVEALYLSATIHRSRGDLAAFEKDLRRVIELQPDHGVALNDLGCLLAQGGTHLQDGIALLRRAVDADAEDAGVAVNLGNALYLAGEFDDAHAAFSAALDRDPSAVEALRGLTMIERRQLRLDDAEQHARAYCEKAPDAAVAQNLLGTVLREKGDFAAARAAFEAALAADPKSAPAASNLGMLELLLGEWAQGFARYEARWNDPTYAPRRSYKGAPHWDGSPGDGRRILLFAEQGYGDCLQFCRFARDVKDKGFRVYLEAPKPLSRLLATLDPEIELKPAEGHDSDVDVIAPLMSLPHLLGIDGPERLSGAPYLQVPADVQAPDVGLDSAARLRVGLNWFGNPEHKEDLKRSLPPAALAPLAEVAGVQFVDLGFGDADRRDRPTFPLLDVSAQIEDFADTAALMRGLDVVVTVDTATAHLAGALGVPCWVLLPYVPDWRWLTGREDCPWYDSVRLFRQPTVGDWADVIGRLASALDERAGD